MFQLVVYVCLLAASDNPASPEKCPNPTQLPVPGATGEDIFSCMKQAYKITEWQKINSQYVVMGKICKKK